VRSEEKRFIRNILALNIERRGWRGITIRRHDNPLYTLYNPKRSKPTRREMDTCEGWNKEIIMETFGRLSEKLRNFVRINE